LILPSDIQNIQQALAGELPGEAAHLAMLPIRKASSTLLKTASNYRESAVAVLLFHENKVLKSVLIERPSYNGTHSGQMAFPGGKKDPTDTDLVHTALREMDEEIGFEDSNIIHLGQLTRVFIPVSQFLVYPHVFYSQNIYPFTPDPIEVSQIVTFPLFDICQSDNKTTTTIPLDSGVNMKSVPCFVIESKIVWGATALIMEELRTILQKIFG